MAAQDELLQQELLSCQVLGLFQHIASFRISSCLTSDIPNKGLQNNTQYEAGSLLAGRFGSGHCGQSRGLVTGGSER
jgi:hypothetical protein